MPYLTFNWHNFAMVWNLFMRFPAKLFILTALSVYNNSIETVYYENKPIQIYGNILPLKNETFQIKILIFFIFLLKT